MSVSSKQDRQGARTPTDLEYKYQFGKTFAEIMGIATDARNTAELAAELDEQLTQEEIFNRLTNNGEVQAVFRGEDGQLYINAAYIVALAELFAKDITMTGTFSNTVEAFIEPGDEEILAIQNHIVGNETIIPSRIPLYDFSGDGKLTTLDCRIARKAQLGIASLENWSGAVKTPVTLTINLNDPEKAIRITGTNMWGREIDEYIGANGTSIKNHDTELRIDALEEDMKPRLEALEKATSGIQSYNLRFDENTDDSFNVDTRGVVKVYVGLNGNNGYCDDVVYVNNGNIESITRNGKEALNYSLTGDLMTVFCDIQWSYGFAITHRYK